MTQELTHPSQKTSSILIMLFYNIDLPINHPSPLPLTLILAAVSKFLK